MEIARAHHGSLSHEERALVEELLKSGQLPCLVATSSLELGIDMGAIDLVVQIESPKSVTRGLQRVGRAGHSLGEVSKGRIFPKFRADLLECAVVARRMRSGEIEETVIPQNPLDVLAQHLVSMAALDEWEVDEVEALVHSAQPFAELSREQLENVLDMLDGRYPSERFAELKPRIVWDRAKGTMRGRPGARQLAIANAGTIPDRGLYGVHLPDGRRVGELDEEMVYEARPGQTFLLGATTWRIEDITRDRVIVTPAPGVPGAVPFWRGDGIGRPSDLGRAIGAFAREAVNADPKRLAAENDLDELAAQNLVGYLTEQQAATRVVPSDENIVVERFRDEIGDWRLCVLSPYGGRVHAAWGLALSAKIRDERELEADAIWSDDGIVVHLPDADEPPPADLVLLEPDEIEDLVVRELSGSALFGARFRENAARSLLIPRAWPGKRTPLWQQRLKSQSLLEVARDFPRFPVILETYREVLRDVLDLPALRELLGDLQSRRLTLVEVETSTASPFASSLLFDYVATYMYEGDTPNAERRAAALALDRDLLRELLGQEELRELIDPEALAEVEDSLQQRAEMARAKDRDALQTILRRVGDLTLEEAGQRVAEGYSAASMLEKLVTERRAAKVRVAGEERYIAAEDAGLYRDALGVPPPAGLPESFLAPVEDAMVSLTRRYAATHGPFPTAPARGSLQGGSVPGAARARGGRRPRPRRAAARRHRARVVRRRRAAAHPARQPRAPAQGGGGHGPRGAGALPAQLAERGRAPPPGGGARPPARRARAAPGGGADPEDLGARRPAAAPRRLQPEPGWTSSARAASWSGSAPGRWGATTARSRSTSARTSASQARRPATRRSSRRRARPTTRSASGWRQGPCFWLDLLELDGSAEELHEALWDLAWSGEVTNDAFAPLRAPRLRAAQRGGARRAAVRAPPGRRGRHRDRPLVADRAAVRGRALGRPAPAGAGRADAGAPRDRHPRDRDRRGSARRVRRDLRRAAEPGAARHRAPRLLRRGPRRGAVRAARRGRAAAQHCRARTSRSCWSWPPPTRPTRTARRCPGRSSRARGGRPGARAPTCCSRDGEPIALRRARRPRHPQARPAGGSGAGLGAGGAGRGGARGADREARGRAARRRAGDRLGDGGGAGRGGLQASAAPPGRLSPPDGRGRHDPPRRACASGRPWRARR